MLTAPDQPVLTAPSPRECPGLPPVRRADPRLVVTGAPPSWEEVAEGRGNVPRRTDFAVTELSCQARAGDPGVMMEPGRSARRISVRPGDQITSIIIIICGNLATIDIFSMYNIIYTLTGCFSIPILFCTLYLSKKFEYFAENDHSKQSSQSDKCAIGVGRS